MKKILILSCLIVVLVLSVTPGFAADKGGGLPKVAFMPFESTMAVGPSLAEDVRYLLAKTMKTKEVFDARKLDSWLDETYAKKKATNIDDIIANTKRLKFDMKYICSGIIFKIDYRYGLFVSMLPMADGMKAAHFIRYFTFPTEDEKAKNKAIVDVAGQIVDEMVDRMNPPRKIYFDKTIYFQRINTNLIQTTEVKSTGEKIITSVNVMEAGGTEYTKDDFFLHEILAYQAHASGLFDIKVDGVNNYVQDEPAKPKDAAYVVSGNLFIEKNFNMLLINIKDGKTDELIQSYKFPFSGMTVESVTNALRKNALLVELSALDIKERDKVGPATILIKKADQAVFCNGFYMGAGDIGDLLLPVGDSNLRISNNLYKLFVFPYTKNEQFWDITDAIISDLINIVDSK